MNQTRAGSLTCSLLVCIDGWVSEFTVVVFGVKVLNDGVGNLEEVGHVDGVANVGVNIILEMLEHVHVFLNVCVSSNSWEGECLIEEFPGVDCELWC